MQHGVCVGMSVQLLALLKKGELPHKRQSLFGGPQLVEQHLPLVESEVRVPPICFQVVLQQVLLCGFAQKPDPCNIVPPGQREDITKKFPVPL